MDAQNDTASCLANAERRRTLILPLTEAEYQQLKAGCPCTAVQIVDVDNGTARLEITGAAPAADESCDWCSGKGYVVQVGPRNQEAHLPCSRCGGSGKLEEDQDAG